MKITREVIQGVVEEEIEEARLRKKVRERIQGVVTEREEKREAKNKLPKVAEAIDQAIEETPNKYESLISDLEKLKEGCGKLHEKYDVE